MPTTTTTYSFNKPVVGADEDSWGGYLNGNWDSVDDLLDGTTPITGIDINSGTLDGVTIGGTTAGAGTFTTLTANTSITGTLATAAQPNVTSLGTLTSLTVSGDVSFGDNDKAIFGAGSDLQIYHDGSNSYIDDAGTGSLRIRAQDLLLADAAGNPFIAMLDLGTGGSVSLRHNTVEKLATTSTGIDVTGTVTADGLTVDGNGTTNVISGGGANDVLAVKSTDNTSALSLVDTNGSAKILTQSDGRLRFYRDGDANSITSANSKLALSLEANGDISFYEDTGTTAKFFWDASAERLGIGTMSPDNPLHVVYADSTAYSDATGDFGVQIENTDTTTNSFSQLHFRTGNSDSYIRSIREGDNLSSLAFLTDDGGTTGDVGEVMRLTSGGNVGIGTSSPQRQLQVGEYGTGSGTIAIAGATNGYGYLLFGDSIAGNGIYRGAITYDHTNDAMLLNTSATERMRIDSSGNVGIGTTSPFYPLSVRNTSFATVAEFRTIDGTNNPGLEIKTSASGTTLAQVYSSGASANLILETNNTERMRIDSSGNLLVGTTDTTLYNNGAGGNTGVILRGSVGNIQAARSDGAPIDLNRLDDDGDIAVFQKDGTTVGSIGSANSGGTFDISGAANNVRITGGNAAYWVTSGAFYGGTANTRDLGTSTYRWKDLYLSGGVYLGGTGSANKLDDYEEGTWTPTINASGATPTVSSYDTRIGKYTKIGDTVTFIAVIRATISSAGTGSPRVTGLPFSTGTSLTAAYLGLQNLLSGTPTPYISSSHVQIDAVSYVTGSNNYLCVSGIYKV